MAWNNIFKKKEKLNENHEANFETIKNELEEFEKKLKPEEKWIWVEGYKGTTENMTGYNDFQFELGVEYTAVGDIELCGNGFHFCLNLDDVNKYYTILDFHKHRFFKVKALVRELDVKNYGTTRWTLDQFGSIRYFENNKLVAKKIILTEEITFSDEMLSYVKRRFNENIIETIEDLTSAWAIGYQEYADKKVECILSASYSDLFRKILLEKCRQKAAGFQISSDAIDFIVNKVREANAYMEEGLSKDVAVYLLMRDM